MYVLMCAAAAEAAAAMLAAVAFAGLARGFGEIFSLLAHERSWSRRRINTSLAVPDVANYPILILKISMPSILKSAPATTMMPLSMIPLLCWLLLASISSVESIQLRTSCRLRGVSSAAAHSFLASPSNWPKIVASSHSVRAVDAKNDRTDVPMKANDSIDETFGFPPLLPLSVRWICEKSNVATGALAFYSPDGLRNVAKDCRMIFSIKDEEGSSMECCRVDFTMEYDPVSPLATVAMPILELDNQLAIKVLLPRVINST